MRRHTVKQKGLPMTRNNNLWLKGLVSLSLCVVVSPAAGQERADSAERELRDVIGVTHVSGAYHLTEKDFLNEGADQILALGSRVIKLYLTVPPSGNPVTKAYPFRSNWPEAHTPAELARTPYFRSVFDKPFTTYILTTYSGGRYEHYWRQGTSDEQARDEQRQFYELTRYLLTTYRGTGKTFVLQHWEGDWAVRGSFDRKTDPSDEAVEGMIRWLSARQDGVDRARAETAAHGVRVLHAAEVNLVKIALEENRPTVADQVLPHTNLDLVSYSAWDTQGDPKVLRAALDYIARHAGDRRPLGPRNVYLGEFGLPENDFPLPRVQQTVRGALDTALDWGCPYVVYWQLYCNEPRRRPVRTNDDTRGFWLIRPDRTKSWAWGELQRRLARRGT